MAPGVEDEIIGYPVTAATTADGRYASPRTITAQTIRAILLAKATAASFLGLFFSSLARHGSLAPFLPFSTAVAPFTSRRRK
jgi:hypothetical protein